MSKIIAFHLPQFHSIPENDEWWGEGFTEWTNTKKAVKLFKNHNQPREPLNDNYYNMLDFNTRKNQAELAKRHGIYGFCYYHYWFNGKLLLEKPLESLLKDKEINFPFCLCWANEPWTRAYDGSNKEILIDQKYGNEEEWNKHFNYLYKFFKDERYIKENGKPILVIYKTASIPRCDDMIKYLDNKCKENGLNGIHIVEEINSFQKEAVCTQSEAILTFEPMNTIAHDAKIITRLNRQLQRVIRKLFKIYLIEFHDYDYIWKKIIKRKFKNINKNIYLGGFVDWDNTARKGRKGIVFNGTSPEKFEKYLKLLNSKSNDMNSKYIFINAWNEWAEGTYLEPDKVNGIKYLQAIKRCIEH